MSEKKAFGYTPILHSNFQINSNKFLIMKKYEEMAIVVMAVALDRYFLSDNK